MDGIIWTDPVRRVWRYNVPGPSAFGIRISVAMQHYNSTMAAGTLTVSVIGKGDHNVDLVNESTLFVQTFN